MITVVSMPGCPYCSLVKALLRRHGKIFSVEELACEDERQVFKRSHGVTTFPQVFLDNVRIGGFEDTERFLSMSIAQDAFATAKLNRNVINA